MNTGHAFSDHIRTEKIYRRRYDDRPPSRQRGYILVLFLAFSCLVLLFQLFSIQIVKGNYYRTLSDSNRIRTKIIHAPRGVITDRHGIPLVLNTPGFRQIVHKDDEDVPETKLLTRDQALSLLAKGDSSLEIDSLREYPYKDGLAHVLGYVGQISAEDLKKPEYKNYGLTDFIGKSGIESQYEMMLSGTDGRQLIEVDAMGKPKRTLGQTDPIPGQDITLTLDAKLQQGTFKAMDGVKKGAAIVATPNGEILAMVSKPSYDPNLFTLDTTYKTGTTSGYTKVEQILLDGDGQPLLNRAIGGMYPPGSTFKLITAAAGLEEKIIDEKYIVKDTGKITIGQYSFSNWYFTQHGGTDGDVDVTKAISRSNDIYFYKLAEKINVDRLSAMASKFGVGKHLGIDLEGEVDGVLPTKEWKQKEVGEPWYLGDTFIYGIGQGFLLTNPLHVNVWTQAIANGGTIYQPRLLRMGEKNKVLQNDFLSDKTVDLVRRGMLDSCMPGGVGWPLFEFKVKNKELREKIDGKNFLEAKVATGSAAEKEMVGVSVACKTGTAQHGDEDTLPHAWITLFAPAYDPEIVVTVLNESSGEGSSEAGPVAKKILEAWFGERKD
jgi:penicillin-binding protein 2